MAYANQPSLDTEFVLNVLDAILILAVAIPTLVIAASVKQGRLRIITSLLVGFLVLHGIYHFAAAASSITGLNYLGALSDLVIEPVGWIIFLAFAVYLARHS